MTLIYKGMYYDCYFNSVMYVIVNKALEHEEVFVETMPSAISQCRAMNAVMHEIVKSNDEGLVAL